MTNGTPFTGAMSAHIANIRQQNGPGAAYVQPSVSDRRSLAVGDRVLLGDHAAHRDADQVEVGEPELVDQRLGVVGEQLRRVRAGRRSTADAAVVEAQHAVAGASRSSIWNPRSPVVGQAVDQHDGLVAVAFEPVVDVDAVDVMRSAFSLLSMRHVPAAVTWQAPGGRPEGGQRRRVAAADVDGDGAARVEAAARRGWMGLGISPRTARASQAAARVGVGDRGDQRLRVRVPAAGRAPRRSGPSSTIRPRYMTTARSAMCSTTARLWVMNRIARPRSRCSSATG